MRFFRILIVLILIMSLLTFGATNDGFIQQLPLFARYRFRAFLYAVRSLGYNIIITSGLRTAAEQNRLHAINPKNAKGGGSSHETGKALDLNFTKGAIHLRKASPLEDWNNSGIPALAAFFGIKWGGTAYKTYYDPVHFELT